MTNDRVQLYGITTPEAAPDVAAALAALWERRPEVIDAGPVAGIAGPVTGGARPALSGRRALGRHLHRLQRSWEVACQAGAFLPARAEVRARDTAMLAGFLQRAAPSLAASLGRFAGSHQWDISLAWEPVAMLRLLQARGALQVSDDGDAASAVKIALTRLRSDLITALRAAVMPYCHLAGDIKESGGDVEPALLLPLLVPAEETERVEAALNALDNDWCGQLSIAMKGPQPPLAFAAIGFAGPAPNRVRQARRRLSLPARVDIAALKDAYRRMARALHPDHAGSQSSDAMAGLAESYRILSDLAARQAENGAAPGQLDCTRPEQARGLAVFDESGGRQAA